MIARRVKLVVAAILLVLLLVVVAAAAFAAWVLHTESGTAWAWRRVAAAMPGELTARTFDGSFAGGLRVAGLRYTAPAIDVRAERLELAIDPGLFPPSLAVEVLDAGGVDVRLPPPAGREDAPERPFSPASLALPFELILEDLRLERFALSNAAGDVLLAIDRAALAGRWYQTVTLSKLELESPQGGVSGEAALALRRPFAADAALEVRYPLALGDQTVPLAFDVLAAGDLEELDVRLESTQPALTVKGVLHHLLEEPAWALEARSPTLAWPLEAARPTVTGSDLVVASRGSASGYTLSGTGTLSAPDRDPLRFELAGSGDTRGIEIERLALTGPLLAAESQGALGWANGFAVRVDAQVDRFDPALLTAAWPAGMPVTGRASGAFRPGHLELETVEAEVKGTRQALSAAGVVDLEAGVVDLDLGWHDLRWPVSGEDLRVESAQGQVAVTGRPEAWTLDGRLALAAPELPPGTFELTGKGSREAATVVIEDSEVLGGRVAGRVHYALPEGGRWVATLSASGVETGALLPDWPGTVSAELATSGRVEPLEVTVDFEELSGTLRGRPLAGSGGVRFAQGNLAVQDLSLTSGDAKLRADGSLRGEAGLDFMLDVPSLAAVLPNTAGALSGGGNISLARDFPRAKLDLEGRELAWGHWQVGTLRVRASEGDAPLVLDVDAQALVLAGFEVSRLAADLAAGETRQRLTASAAAGERKIEIALDGAFEDWRRPLASGWRGRLETLALDLPPELGLALASPADLGLGPERVMLERACLAAADGPARVCAGGAIAGADDFRLSADLTALPLALVKLGLDTELEFTQALDGSFALERLPGRALSADARIDISPGRVHNPANRRIRLETRAGSFALDLDQGQVLLAHLDLPVGEAAAIEADFGVEDVRRGPQSPIRGKVVANVNDIGVLTALVPSIQSARGRLAVDLAVAGTLEQPAVTGEASLKNGALAYAPLGLELADIELTSRIGADNHVDLASTFRAGEGTGRLYSSTNGLAGGELRLRLVGDDLTVVKLPQVEVVADMDVGVGVTPGEITLEGEVQVPHARLSPREIAVGRVSESEDVVIVAGGGSEEETAAVAGSPLAFQGKVGLTLGDDVIVDFDAAQTRLTGAVAFAWNGPPIPTATGEYKVAGRFEAYGQLLEITEGSIGFPGVPATNPQLRIRAEREIFGNPQIHTAGVLVSGNARDPDIEVYTTPATNEERALTLLVTGSDFDYEQGVGAVDVGTYVAPDLFLSYGIGLFDRDNVISLRYDLAKGFGIKATSGKSTEGVDLSYTFER